MKLFLILALATLAVARPQYSERDSSGSGATVNCVAEQGQGGSYTFNCQNANPGTITEEKTLWVPSTGGSEELVIRVPNYNFREIIRAGLRSGEAGGTNVRVHVARPQVESTVEGEFKQAGRTAPAVSVTYDGITNKGEVHYGPGGQNYSPLSRPIAEPGQRF